MDFLNLVEQLVRHAIVRLTDSFGLLRDDVHDGRIYPVLLACLSALARISHRVKDPSRPLLRKYLW